MNPRYYAVPKPPNGVLGRAHESQHIYRPPSHYIVGGGEFQPLSWSPQLRRYMYQSAGKAPPSPLQRIFHALANNLVSAARFGVRRRVRPARSAATFSAVRASHSPPCRLMARISKFSSINCVPRLLVTKDLTCFERRGDKINWNSRRTECNAQPVPTGQGV